ncbi:MAG: hypothetical protein Q9207_003874 [Kuettlingeria erythrocarpa]
MLAHTDIPPLARPHKPVRNSTLRQVTSRYDGEQGAGKDESAQESSPVSPPLDDQTAYEQIVSLGLHDGHSTTSTVLLHPDIFPTATGNKQTVIKICAIDDQNLVYEDNHAQKTKPRKEKSIEHGQVGGNVFFAEPMLADMAAKPNSAKLDPEECQASHVEIAFRDEYLSRSDMWRLVVSELAGKMVHKGQRIAFMNTIKVVIRAIYLRGQRVPSALFSSSTKPVFRSESARYVLFIQMSKEMWDFDTDGTGQIMFDKVINGFLPDLFKRWQHIAARHLVTIVMFSRLDFKQGAPVGPLSFGAQAAEQVAFKDTPIQDYYRVVVSDMPSGDWSDILLQLKKEFRIFLRDISVQHPVATRRSDTNSDPQFSSGGQQPNIITGRPLSALHGNILEAVNLASSQFSCDYIDRDLVRTGVSVIVITPGTGLFEVDYDLLATTTDNLIENGVGIDLVCLSRLPLHSVPLFKYRPPMSNKLQRSNHARGNVVDQPADRLAGNGGQLPVRRSSLDSSLGSSWGDNSPSSATRWNYGIPHWVDVSYWTSPSSDSQNPAAGAINGRERTANAEGRRIRKPFIPRARMYELQMMGVMENSIDQIRLPYLLKVTAAGTSRPTPQNSLPKSTLPASRSPAYGHLMSKVHVPSSSIASTSSLSATRDDPQYRWMEDYDSSLFQHPKKGERSHKKSRPSKLIPTSTDKKRQGGRINTTSRGVRTSSESRSGSIRSSKGFREPRYLTKQHDPPEKSTGQRPSDAGSPSMSSRASLPRPAKISRHFSLGFPGFGVNMAKATASTEISTEYAPAIVRPHYIQSKLQDLNSDASIRREPSLRQASGSPIASVGPKEGTNILDEHKGSDPTRPIPIRNPTAIRIWSREEDSQSSGSYHSTTLTLPPNDNSEAAPSWQQAKDMHEDYDQLPPMSPRTAMAPWLTVVNPSNPKSIDSNSTSRLGRWQHIFPKKLRASKIKWKSLCSPAAVPLTTEEFPPADKLGVDYESSTYKVVLRADEELLERPRSQDWLIREMMAFRFSQGFQVVIGPRLADALYLPNFDRFDVFDDEELARTDTTIVMSRGSVIHKISAAGSSHVEVECLTRRSAAKPTVAEPNDSESYKPMIRTMLAEDYLMQHIPIGAPTDRFDWAMIDSHLADHPKQEAERYDESLRAWRARLVLIPVNPSSSTRRPLQPLNEDNEEELRLEGIRKLTQLWQRFRYLPPSERRFQAPIRKRKDTNPLDIMYQTRNPSAIVAAEKDNMGEDVSTGKPVQLLPESELFQRSNLNLQALAQTIQGEKGVRMMDRRWHWRLHYNCFIGFELTSWLLQNFRDVDTREEAVELGNDLMREGLFQHVEQRHNFRDGNYFYQVASDYRAARPESRSTWFGSKKTEKAPSTAVSEGEGPYSPKLPASRSSQTNDGHDEGTSAPNANRQRLGVALSKSLLYDVDHRKRSYRPELITLHYDRLHNPDNCYHIRIDWMNTTPKLIEDAIVSWAASVERFGLRLVEVPLAEASTITSMHPFRAPALVKLAKIPPSEQPQTYFDATSFTPQAKTEKHFYQKALMKKFDFILDFEAASDFPADVDVTYSWGKPDYRFPQYIHRSGTLLAQITDEGHFLLLANRLYTTRTYGAPESARIEPPSEGDTAGAITAVSAPRTSRHRGSPHASPFASPLIRAAAAAASSPKTTSSAFATPEQIKKQFEAFCADAKALDAFYADVLSKTSTPAAVSTPGVSTPAMESSIPALGLPPSLMERGKSPAPEAGRLKTRIIGSGSPSVGARGSGP